MKTRVVFGTMVASLALLASGVAHAQVQVDGPVFGNSSTFGVAPIGGGPYDLVAVQVVSAGDVLEAFTVSQGTFNNPMEPGWSLGFFSSTLAVASGPGLNPLVWANTTFAGDNQPVVWDVAHWEVGAMGGPTRLSRVIWDGSGFDIGVSDWGITRDGAQSLIIPLPTPLGMGLAGLGLIGVARRRR